MMNRFLAILLLLPLASYGTSYYVDSVSGNDTNAGTVGAPVATITRVNALGATSGDAVYFARGGSWRCPVDAYLTIASGVTYGAYGAGAQPILYGSYDLGDSNRWTNVDGNIWQWLNPAPTSAVELLTNPSFDTNTTGWITTGGTISRDTNSYDSAPASLLLTLTNSSNFQLYVRPLSVVSGTTYVLNFAVRSTHPFAENYRHTPIISVGIYQTGSPYADYSSGEYVNNFDIGDAWTNKFLTWKSTATAADARISFTFTSPTNESWTFSLDTLSLKAVDSGFQVITSDVGNVIFNGNSYGAKQESYTNLTAQGNFWNYETDWGSIPPVNERALYLYSVGNPGTNYTSIEAAQGIAVLYAGDASGVTIENLHVRYAGYVGIRTWNLTNSIIQDCTVNHAGGTYQLGYSGGDHTRIGAGINMEADNISNTVQRCSVSQTWDGGIGQESQGEYDTRALLLASNTIWDCSNGIEGSHPTTLGTTNYSVDMTFAHNTIVDVGWNWCTDQRPVAGGKAFSFGRWGGLEGTTYGYTISSNNVLRDNLVYGSRVAGIQCHYTNTLTKNISASDYNLYWQTNGVVYLQANTTETNEYDLPAYVALIGYETNSLAVDPLFVDYAGDDFRLKKTSPARQAGSVGLTIGAASQVVHIKGTGGAALTHGGKVLVR